MFASGRFRCSYATARGRAPVGSVVEPHVTGCDVISPHSTFFDSLCICVHAIVVEHTHNKLHNWNTKAHHKSTWCPTSPQQNKVGLVEFGRCRQREGLKVNDSTSPSHVCWSFQYLWLASDACTAFCRCGYQRSVSGSGGGVAWGSRELWHRTVADQGASTPLRPRSSASSWK